jgi:hypothetical protein
VAFSSVTYTFAIDPSFVGTSPWSMSQALSSPICRPTSTRISRSASARRTHGTAPSGRPSRRVRRTNALSSPRKRRRSPTEPIMMRSKSSAIIA